MSLTSQLHDGVLGAWCREHLPGVAELTERVRSVSHYVRPVSPGERMDPQHWAVVGAAFGQRFAFVVQHAPPYRALLGAHRAGLVRWPAVQYGATAFLSHWGLAPGDRERACQLRPTPTGWLDLDIGAAPAVAPPWPSQPGSCEHTVLEFVARIAAYLSTHAPAGDLSGRRESEAALARGCWVLAGWEQAYRTGALAGELARLPEGGNIPSVADLTAAAPQGAVDELLALVAQARSAGALHRLRELAGHPPPGAPLGYAAPVFVPHWAEGELLLGTGETTTLLDVRTVLRPQDPQRVHRWLFQLAGYAWLDVADRYRIRRVGLYLARHGLLLTWPLEEFTATLLRGRSRPPAARREFLGLAGPAIAAEGADPRWLSAPPASRARR